jgi:DNA-binding GntR family transcriptional regulator
MAILESVFDTITKDDLAKWQAIDDRYSNRTLTREEMDKFSGEESIHLLLCQKCDNPYLRDVYIRFFEKVLLICSVIAHSYCGYADHSDILKAIGTGNMETSKEALKQHLELARLSIHDHLNKK